MSRHEEKLNEFLSIEETLQPHCSNHVRRGAKVEDIKAAYDAAEAMALLAGMTEGQAMQVGRQAVDAFRRAAGISAPTNPKYGEAWRATCLAAAAKMAARNIQRAAGV
jgi:hypothetical protein